MFHVLCEFVLQTLLRALHKQLQINSTTITAAVVENICKRFVLQFSGLIFLSSFVECLVEGRKINFVDVFAMKSKLLGALNREFSSLQHKSKHKLHWEAFKTSQVPRNFPETFETIF